MEYAMQLLVPILGGLLLGYWLHQQFGVSPIWTIVLAVLGMFMGLGIMYKRTMYPQLYKQSGKQANDSPQPSPEKRPGTLLPWEDDNFRLDEEDPDAPEYKDDDDNPFGFR